MKKMILYLSILIGIWFIYKNFISPSSSSTPENISIEVTNENRAENARNVFGNYITAVQNNEDISAFTYFSDKYKYDGDLNYFSNRLKVLSQYSPIFLKSEDTFDKNIIELIYGTESDEYKGLNFDITMIYEYGDWKLHDFSYYAGSLVPGPNGTLVTDPYSSAIGLARKFNKEVDRYY